MAKFVYLRSTAGVNGVRSRARLVSFELTLTQHLGLYVLRILPKPANALGTSKYRVIMKQEP